MLLLLQQLSSEVRFELEMGLESVARADAGVTAVAASEAAGKYAAALVAESAAELLTVALEDYAEAELPVEAEPAAEVELVGGDYTRVGIEKATATGPENSVVTVYSAAVAAIVGAVPYAPLAGFVEFVLDAVLAPHSAVVFAAAAVAGVVETPAETETQTVAVVAIHTPVAVAKQTCVELVILTTVEVGQEVTVELATQVAVATVTEELLGSGSQGSVGAVKLSLADAMFRTPVEIVTQARVSAGPVIQAAGSAEAAR